MKTTTLRKNVLIGTVILFIAGFLVPTTTLGTIIYVDDDNTSPPWNGTPEHPYQHIGDGVNHAGTGDTVYVFNGVYYENVAVNKSIDLTGQSRDSTIIDGGGTGNVISISAAGVRVSEFGIRKSGSSGVWLYYTSNVEISGNIITNCNTGIGMQYSSHNYILGNNIINNALGISLYKSSEIVISENTIKRHVHNGITLFYSSNNTISQNALLNSNNAGISSYWRCDNNVISGNTIADGFCAILLREQVGDTEIVENDITDNRWDALVLEDLVHNSLISGNNIDGNKGGIYMSLAYDNVISANDITNNTPYGGISLDAAASDNTISGNTITNNSKGLSVSGGSNNDITGNIISNNGENGVFSYISGSSNNICGNNITNNARHGIYVEWVGNGIISDNIISNNGGNGILLWASSNIVEANTIADNAQYGIFVRGADWNTIFHNSFINNLEANAHNVRDNDWDNGYPSGGNYWSDFDEPIEGAYDEYCGPDQNISGSDGIVDTPYWIPGDGKHDRYPLTQPWSGVMPTTIFVDADQPAGWYNLTHVKTIQQGVNNATGGDIIYVFNGTYHEHVTVDKQLLLVGQNMEGVIIDGNGSGHVVNISADRVRLRGFTVRNGSVGIEVCSDHNAISENVITDNKSGIQLQSPSNSNFVFHNNFIDNAQHGHDPYNNLWHHGYLYGGNYWDDYTGSDEHYGPNQDVPGSDGMGDTPYHVSGGVARDRYPLMTPWDGTFLILPLSTVYVHDQFHENTPGWGYDHFNRIQDGVDAVTVGGTVLVSNGSYYENVVVEKPINLVGESQESTIVYGGTGDVILISADSVSMTGFMVKNGSKGINLSHSSNSQVFDNIITCNDISGIRLANSNNNTISGNTITKTNSWGINLYGSNDNRISTNIIEDNEFGIFEDRSSIDNTVFHNDFINNDQNAYVVHNNVWDKGYPSGGNYWHDYMGVDHFSGPDQDIPGSDGIGDTPYVVTPGSMNEDRYPLMNTCCGLYAGANGPYVAFVDEPLQFKGSAHGNSPPYSYYWEFGDGDTSNAQNPTHTYNAVGEYTATLTVADSTEDSDTDTAVVTVKPQLSFVWVDNDYDENTPGWEYDRFDNINDGIDAVYYGGTVYVHNGTYHEHVAIDKTINLIGEDRDSVMIDGDGAGDVVYISADGVNISGFTLQNGGGFMHDGGIDLSSNYNVIYGNNVINNAKGIYLHSSSGNTISGNNFTNNGQGMKLDGSSENTITDNFIADNQWYSIKADTSCHSNMIYHNNFINNNQNAYDQGSNMWDDGYPSGGNCWDDYPGSDDFSGPGQNIPGSDGIGDTPYYIQGGSNQDHYPLMSPWIPYVCGDANGDGEVDVADIVYLVNYLFTGGSAPQPLDTGDANCGGEVDIADVVYLVNYLFIGGSPPGC